MKKIQMLNLILCLYSSTFCFAHCDLSTYRYECHLSPKLQPSLHHSSLVYCGNIPLYLTLPQYKILADYQRANVNRVLKVNGQYIDSPCYPAGANNWWQNAK